MLAGTSLTYIYLYVGRYLFDLLLLGEEALLQLPLRERRAQLRAEFDPVAREVQFAEGSDHRMSDREVSGKCQGSVREGSDHRMSGGDGGERSEAADAPREVLRRELLSAVAAGCEGLMVKRLDWKYEPTARRSDGWLKLKKDYLEGMGDSLDLVPVGGWRGQGRKSRWISPWLMATYDPVEGTFGSVCRVMSGFTDAFYRENTVLYMGREFGESEPSAAAGEGDDGEEEGEEEEKEEEEEEEEEENDEEEEEEGENDEEEGEEEEEEGEEEDDDLEDIDDEEEDEEGEEGEEDEEDEEAAAAAAATARRSLKTSGSNASARAARLEAERREYEASWMEALPLSKKATRRSAKKKRPVSAEAAASATGGREGELAALRQMMHRIEQRGKKGRRSGDDDAPSRSLQESVGRVAAVRSGDDNGAGYGEEYSNDYGGEGFFGELEDGSGGGSKKGKKGEKEDLSAEDLLYAAAASASASKKSARRERRKAAAEEASAADAAGDWAREYVADEADEGSKRKIDRNIEKNRGLTRQRKKIDSNTRVKNREKFRKKVIARKGQVRDKVTLVGPYGGELTGIKKNVSHSRRFK